MKSVINFMKWFQDVCIFILTGLFITLPIQICITIFNNTIPNYASTASFMNIPIAENKILIIALYVLLGAVFVFQLIRLVFWLRNNITYLIKHKETYLTKSDANYNLIVLIFLYPFYCKIFELKELTESTLLGIKNRYVKSTLSLYVVIMLFCILRDFKIKSKMEES